jgi:CRP-like cAMP-binding protein
VYQTNAHNNGADGNSSRSDTSNLLLSLLSAKDYGSIAPHLHAEELPLKKTLYLPDEPISRVYFLNSGMVSTVAEQQEGGSVEVGVTGFEGVVGVSVLLGGDRTPNHVYMQIEGNGLAIEAKLLMELMDKHDALRGVLHKYVYTYIAQVSQTAVCNRIHEVGERLARWLLMSHDRCRGCDVMPMTHEFLGLMLGTRRSSVTMAALLLQEAGIIEYRHGSLRIISRAKLEESACECYAIVRREHERIFPVLTSRSFNLRER